MLEGKIANLVAAVEPGDGLEPLVAQLRDLLAAIATAKAVDQLHADRGVVEARVQAQVTTWRALIDTAVVSDGRQLVNEMLEGPLRFFAEGRTYRFVGPVATGRLIAGMVGLPPNGTSPTGFGPLWGREVWRPQRGVALSGRGARTPESHGLLPIAA